MFKKAVNAHAQLSQSIESDSSDGQSKFSSSQIHTNGHDATHINDSNTRSSQYNVLQPVTLSGLNRPRPATSRPFKPPIKRTSSGLAKAIGNTNGTSAFEEHSLARRRSETSSMRSQSRSTNSNQTSVIIDEDDFDSDVDLDVEELVNNASVTYPKLPSVQYSQAQVSYPKIQQARLHTSATNTLHPSPPTNQHASPVSSVPIPWSSSPIEHKQPPQKQNLFTRFSLNTDQVASTLNESDRNIVASDPPLARPSKRRTLPWLAAQPGESDESQTSATYPMPASTKHQSNGLANETPASKRGPAVSYPWNTTASAMKEQQKQLRKASKKALKSNEAVDESKDFGLLPKKAKGSSLSDEQQHVLNLVVDSGKSVFFTGSAGTGKSVLLREIIAVLKRKHMKESDRVAITASTGLAACNIGGVTLHSFAGIGLGKEDVPELVKKIKRNQKAKHRWLRTKFLIIDEISMVDGELFDKLEEIARRVRSNGRPFGGIKLVITGDFFQLPPVPDANRIAKFAFDAASWPAAIDHTIGLHHVFRQKDATFANMLNEMREGRLSGNTIKTFQSLSRPIQYDDHLQATELFPTRNEVEAANNKRMSQLTGETIHFEARDGGSITDKAQRDRLLQNCMAPEMLSLKKGSQVMLIKNIDDSLVNGSLGRVKAFMNEQTFEYYNKDPEEFENAQNAADDDLNPTQLKQKRMMKNLGNTSQVWPLVEFQLTDGTTRDMLCNREPWKIELPNGEVQASRQQVPLILAWALSIHKAQGQTLERVKVDLGKIFERGQAYVALSRATTMDGLQVLRFDANKVQAHDKVKGFYAGLSRAQESGGRVVDYDEHDAGYY